jgi:hypothetical protein
VCGAGAFVILKALAFRIRDENKDAYDLYYLLRNFGRGVADGAAELRPCSLIRAQARRWNICAVIFKTLISPGQVAQRNFLTDARMRTLRLTPLVLSANPSRMQSASIQQHDCLRHLMALCSINLSGYLNSR